MVHHLQVYQRVYQPLVARTSTTFVGIVRMNFYTSSTSILCKQLESSPTNHLCMLAKCQTTFSVYVLHFTSARWDLNQEIVVATSTWEDLLFPTIVAQEQICALGHYHDGRSLVLHQDIVSQWYPSIANPKCQDKLANSWCHQYNICPTHASSYLPPPCLTVGRTWQSRRNFVGFFQYHWQPSEPKTLKFDSSDQRTWLQSSISYSFEAFAHRKC